MKKSRKEEKQEKQFEQLKNYIKKNNVGDFKKLITGNSISGFEFDNTPKGRESLLYSALSQKSPNIYIVESLIERGAIIDKKSEKLLNKNPLVQNKDIKNAIDNGQEASTLKQLGQAFIHANEDKCNHLIKIIQEKGYNINRPVQIFDAEERPVFHAIAVSIDEMKYGKETFAKQKQSIAENITKIKDFNPNVFSMGQEGKGPSPVTSLLGQEGMLGKMSRQLYDPSRFLEEQKVSNVKGMKFDKNTRKLIPVEVKLAEEMDKESTHHKNAVKVVDEVMKELANSEKFTFDKKQNDELVLAVAHRFQFAENTKVPMNNEEMKHILKGEKVNWENYVPQRYDVNYNKEAHTSLSVKDNHITIGDINTFVKLTNMYIGNKQVDLENKQHQQKKGEIILKQPEKIIPHNREEISQNVIHTQDSPKSRRPSNEKISPREQQQFALRGKGRTELIEKMNEEDKKELQKVKTSNLPTLSEEEAKGLKENLQKKLWSDKHPPKGHQKNGDEKKDKGNDGRGY